ncbi:multidrug effflux MFS transporter [Erysipelothrix inopinata]|uniref:Multidrug effflux MFS transporter n=1 Tax=Erysipelothrix inopinata TaxID=225084 RepID=A0A7G9S138_9FIRM|nr:multidrug effflux MFS transporter [Erysipelothrix inopinata]QNN61563.1 multidrug effflux MFS transporter [Erysipelothrix inopinata]
MKKNIENNKPSFILLIVLLGFPQLHEAMISPSIQNIAERFVIHIDQAQLVLSLYFTAFAVGVLFWGYFSDIKGRRPAMISGFITYTIGTLIAIIAPSFTIFMVGRFIGAFGLATGSVTTQTILREAFSQNVRNKLFSQVSIALAFVPGIGPTLGGALVDAGGSRLLLICLVISSMCIVAVTYYRLPETQVQTTNTNINFIEVAKRMLCTKTVWIYGFFITAYNAIMSIYYMEIPLLFTHHFQMSLARIGSFGISLAIATILGALCTQQLLKKYDPQSIIMIGNIFVLCGAIFMVFTTVLVNSESVKPFLYILGMFIVRFGTAISLSNAISLSLNGFEDVYGTAGSLLSLGYYLGISGLMQIMSWIRSNSLLIMPLYFVVLAIIMMGLTYLTMDKSNKNT